MSTGVNFEEFQDMLIYSTSVRINLNTQQIEGSFNGEFSKNENANISAVIRFDGTSFEGIANPIANQLVPMELGRIFQLHSAKIVTEDSEDKLAIFFPSQS